MEDIIYEAGFLLTYALDKLNRSKIINPIYGAIKRDNSRFLKEIKDISLENSIPKAINMFESPKDDIKSAAVLFPAELEDENGRYSVIIVMIMDYDTNYYITIAQPYYFEDGQISLRNYELLDYHEFLAEKLPKLEEEFMQGAFNYDEAEYLWQERFVCNA